jgi:tRNA pseudouridine13 synthase
LNLPVPKIDELLGIEVYATENLGVGGVIREAVDDFVVEEILVDGSKATIKKAGASQVLGVSRTSQQYLLCLLVKRNWDTFIVLKNIAKQLDISQKQIQIAGIKDAKAVTAQHITIENCSMKDAPKVSIKDVEIRPVGYFREKLSPFYLLGNNFTIKIKAINFSESTVEKHITATARALGDMGGMPNFFGYQRFGTTRPITHLVGKAIIGADFKNAAMLFLARPSVHEHPSSRQARKALESTLDFKAALSNFPTQLRFERLMLRHLAGNPEDFVGAFKRLPIKLQALFVQAYQSYLFNRFLSERIKSGFSLRRAEVGDHVVNVERSGLPMFQSAKFVEQENVAEVNALMDASRMRVALPLVGSKQRLSQGVMGQIERQILEEEGIQTGNFRISAIRDMSRGGGLRAVISPVKGFMLKQRPLQSDLSFMLLRGSYATVFLREIMKPSDPIKAGF